MVWSHLVAHRGLSYSRFLSNAAVLNILKSATTLGKLCCCLTTLNIKKSFHLRIGENALLIHLPVPHSLGQPQAVTPSGAHTQPWPDLLQYIPDCPVLGSPEMDTGLQIGQ